LAADGRHWSPLVVIGRPMVVSGRFWSSKMRMWSPQVARKAGLSRQHSAISYFEIKTYQFLTTD
jgi:hypothetical protein